MPQNDSDKDLITRVALARSKCKSVAVAEIGGLKLLVKHRNSRTLGYLTTKLREKDIAIAKTAKSAKRVKKCRKCKTCIALGVQ